MGRVPGVNTGRQMNLNYDFITPSKMYKNLEIGQCAGGRWGNRSFSEVGKESGEERTHWGGSSSQQLRAQSLELDSTGFRSSPCTLT